MSTVPLRVAGVYLSKKVTDGVSYSLLGFALFFKLWLILKQN